MKITLEISDELFKKIEDFKGIIHTTDDNAAVNELLKYALSLPPYFLAFDWEQAEREADADISEGKVKEFSSVDEFFADLKA